MIVTFAFIGIITVSFLALIGVMSIISRLDLD